MNKWRVEIWERPGAGLVFFVRYRDGEPVFCRHAEATTAAMSRETASRLGCQDGWLHQKQLRQMELEQGDGWTRGRIIEEADEAGAA